MKITESQVTKFVLSGLDGLDPITVIMEDVGDGRGILTIACYDKAWRTYWGAMGEGRTIRDFIRGADDHYIAKKLTDIEKEVADYTKLSRQLGDDVDISNLRYFDKQLTEIYGEDWAFQLPHKENPDFTYLRKIVRVVKEFCALEQSPSPESARG